MKFLERMAAMILEDLGCPEGELSLLLVNDLEMEGLNSFYRGILRPTEVLSFPMKEGEMTHVNPHLLGDVVISTEMVKRQAQQEGISFEQRLKYILVHGILHLFGFDHERSEEDAIKMEEREREILRKL